MRRERERTRTKFLCKCPFCSPHNDVLRKQHTHTTKPMQMLTDMFTSLGLITPIMALIVPYITGEYDRLFIRLYRRIRRARRARTVTLADAIARINATMAMRHDEAID